jgi:transglutaminase-like putative cysteine protease
MTKINSPGHGRRLLVLIVAALAIEFSVGLPAALRGRAALPAASGPELIADRWYVIKIAGNPAGYVHEEVEAKAAAQAKGQTAQQAETSPAQQARTNAAPRVLVTTSDMRLVFNRLGSRIELRFLSSADETTAGLLIATSYVMLASSQSTKSDAVVRDGTIEVTSEAGGKTYTNTLDFTGQLHGPEGIRRMSAEGLKRPGDKITAQTFVPEASLIGNLTRVAIGWDDIEVEGKRVPSVKVEETLEGMPVKRTGWLDLEGNLLKQEEPGPFGVMEVVRSEKSTALAAASGAELPAEIYEKSIVRTNIRMPRYVPIDRLKLRLIHRDPSLGWPDFKAENQTVLEKTEKELTLEIRRPAAPRGMTSPVAVNAETRQFLEANAYIQSDDAEIRRLAREIAGTEQDAFEVVLAMERWVAEHMTFDLGIVFAPATEVFHSRRGTCVGYATMLATLARAVGIPSRVAMGYVYAEGMFGGHAWAEVLAGKEWFPVDAAIVNAGGADATHLQIIASSLVNGPGEMGLGAAQQIFGQVDIRILEYDTDKKTIVVPMDAKPYMVEGNRYVNPWLGIELTKPQDFAFAKLDAIWPDPTIVELTGPNGVKARLEEQPVYPWQEPEKAAAERLSKLVPGGRAETLEIGEGPADIGKDTAGSGEGKSSAANEPTEASTAEPGRAPTDTQAARSGITTPGERLVMSLRVSEANEAIPQALENSPRRVPAIYSADGKTAAAAFGRGAVLLVLRVEGPDAADLLRLLAASFRFE